MLLSVSLSSFASETKDIKVSSSVLQAFQKNFSAAKEVSWTVSQNYYKANFSMNGQFVTAFYNNDGSMMAMTKNIASTQLPVALQTSLRQQYSQYWISDLFEMATEEGTSYYITLEDGDTRLVLKSDNAEWSTYQKQRKS